MRTGSVSLSDISNRGAIFVIALPRMDSEVELDRARA